MPYTISIDPDISAVILHAHGPGSREEGLQAFGEALQAARDAGLASLLIDVLELEFVPSSADASVFSGKLFELGGNRLRLALVAPPGEPFLGASMVGMLTELLGARVRVFGTRQEAGAWLKTP